MSKIDEAIRNASQGAEILRSRFRHVATPAAPVAEQLPSVSRLPGQQPLDLNKPIVASVPQGQAAAPPPPPKPREPDLKTATFDDLLNEVQRRKAEALEQLRALELPLEVLKKELDLRNLPSLKLEKLRKIPGQVLEDEIMKLLEEGGSDE